MAIADVPPSSVPMLPILQFLLLSVAMVSAVAMIVVGASLALSVRAGNSRRTADNEVRLFNVRLAGAFMLVASLALAALTAVAAQG